MKNKKKRAFTLTELLIVVIVIGVLSAVVLPKFSKVIETRKTTEAEEIMAAVRTEQEQRCSLNKLYTNDFAKLENALPASETQNYTYNLSGASISATSKGSLNYTLKMPSFADGRICCDTEAEGNQCANLNKDYPPCNELIARADYTQAEAECTPPVPCEGESSRPCGCNNSGTQTRTCDTTTGMWGAWGACQGTHCDCAPDADGMATSKFCNCNGTQTRSCNTGNGTWSTWSNCSGGSSAGWKWVNYTPAGKGPTNCAKKKQWQICTNHQWTYTGSTNYSDADEGGCCEGSAAYTHTENCDCGKASCTCTRTCSGGNWQPCSCTPNCTTAESRHCDCDTDVFYSGHGAGWVSQTCKNGTWTWSGVDTTCSDPMGCTPLPGCSGPNPSGESCSKGTECGCYMSSVIERNGGSVPAAAVRFDPLSYNWSSNSGTFYYAEAPGSGHTCPTGTEWACKEVKGTKSCECTTAGWSCSCN